MAFRVETFPEDRYARDAAGRIAGHLPGQGSLILTGGTTAERIYPALAPQEIDWSGLDLFFSDERCVPPGDAASNYGMAHRLLIGPAGARRVHRMRGEQPPDAAAQSYHDAIAESTGGRFDVALLGMGADNHIAAMFPGSPAIEETEKLCVPVQRPDGMGGLTLTPPAITGADRIFLLVAGRGKAAAMARALQGTDDVSSCPVLLLANHPDVTFLLDDEASSKL